MKTKLIPFQLSNLDNFESFRIMNKKTGEILSLNAVSMIIIKGFMIVMIEDDDEFLLLPIDCNGEILLENEYFSKYKVMMKVKNKSSEDETCEQKSSEKESCDEHSEEKESKKKCIVRTIVETDERDTISDIVEKLVDLMNEIHKK